jgi:peptidoglycan/LPS O-acetylase OafA/YrhL
MFRSAFRDLTIKPHEGLIPWFDFLRSIAVLSVMGGHTVGLGCKGIAAKAFSWGWTGVDLFFVLSGYLIGFQLWRELRDTGSIELRNFWVRRSLRIWPLYFFMFAGYAGWDAVTHRSFSGLAADALFVSNYFHCQVKGGWSLSTEEQFYVLFPVLLLVFRRVRVVRLVWIPVLWMATSPLLRHWKLSLNPGRAAGQVIYSPLHTHSDALAIGVMIALLAATYPYVLKMRRVAVALSISMIAVGVLARVTDHIELSYTSLALIYGGLAVFGLHNAKANRHASWRGFHVLSRLSFGMYLNHPVIIDAVTPYVQRYVATHAASPTLFGVAFATVIACSALISFVTFSLIERPFLRLRDKWLSKGARAGK